jgi:hypothetical protein
MTDGAVDLKIVQGTEIVFERVFKPGRCELDISDEWDREAAFITTVRGLDKVLSPYESGYECVGPKGRIAGVGEP